MSCLETEAAFGKALIFSSPTENNNDFRKLHRLRILPHGFGERPHNLGDPFYFARYPGTVAACMEDLRGD